jgi:D-alanine-D-alanine ligase
MNKKIKVGIIFGGKSAEHEVSLQSAKNVIEAIDKDKYEPVLIGIGKDGKWHLSENSNFLRNSENPKLIELNKGKGTNIALVPQSEGRLTRLGDGAQDILVDVVFPLVHGPFGEDGTLQGLLKLAGVPFVGASVLGSAVGMDKDVMKRLLRDAKIPIAQFMVATENNTPRFKEVVGRLGFPFFVKPANLGSSVGVSKVENERDFKEAVKEAFEYDRKIIIEEYIPGREIECAVLGNEEPLASLLGEVKPAHEFYSYDAKYIDEEGAALEIPVKLSNAIAKKMQLLAARSFQVLECEGMARVDFFLKEDGEAIVNEINTIPGFTKISMYPKLWEVSGVSYAELIDQLITLAIERFNKEQKLKTLRV